MAEAAEQPATKEEPGIESEDIESRIKDAMRARVQHFKEQADSLTFEAVRRMIEQDLGFEKFKLDVHKRFIKQFLVQCLEGEVVDNASKGSGEMVENHVCATKEEAAGCPKELASEKDAKEHGSGDEGKMEDSPVMGLLTAKKATKKTGETPAKNEKEAPSESTIKKAVWKRASYIKANADKVTMAKLRRLLEEDLELDEYVLDPYKKLIREQLDEVLESFEVSKPKEAKKSSRAKSSKNVSDEESMDSLVAESEEEDEKEVKPKKKATPKQKIEGSIKRKRPENNVETSRKKGTKPVKTVAKNNRDEDEEEDHSRSSAEKPVQKKEASTPTYGKHVEHLKSVIKSCGMSVPPVIYKKVKQVPENKREAQLIKELEDILSREGLSSNPSEKEIKEVRKRKERARELEGIDMSNIVSSSRRRSTSSYVAPPKPEVPVGSDNDDDESDEDEDDEDDGDDDDDKNDEENEGDDGDNDGDDDSESEELDKEDDEDSD